MKHNLLKVTGAKEKAELEALEAEKRDVQQAEMGRTGAASWCRITSKLVRDAKPQI